MGYCMDMRGARFGIKREHFDACRRAVSDMMESYPNAYSWVSTDEVLDACNRKDIVGVFRAWRWDVDFSKHEGLTDIEFAGEKLGSDENFFDVIAPFVTDRSYIEMEGEDSCRWRWWFSNGKMQTDHMRAEWDSDEALFEGEKT